MKRLLIFLALLGVTAVMLAPGCTAPDTDGGADKGPITVGSKLDTEASLLSQIIILILQDNGFEVIDKSQFGTTDIVRSAIMSGELDIYPEYTGNGAYFFDETESDVWNDAQQGLEQCGLA